MTVSRERMLPTGQWRTLNILSRTGGTFGGGTVKPGSLYETDLAALVDAEMVELMLDGQRYQARRRGDGFDLGGREWPPNVRLALTGRGMRWLRENIYQQALVALRSLRARPGRPVPLPTAMYDAGLKTRDVYLHLAQRGLINAARTTGQELRRDTDLLTLDLYQVTVALTRKGMNVAAADLHDD